MHFFSPEGLMTYGAVRVVLEGDAEGLADDLAQFATRPMVILEYATEIQSCGPTGRSGDDIAKHEVCASKQHQN